MDEWCTNTHGASGLTKRVKESTIDEAQAEQQTLEFLQQHLEAGKSPLCGNSIGQDRRFLVKYMPRLEEFSTTAIWMYLPSRSWRDAGGLMCWRA